MLPLLNFARGFQRVSRRRVREIDVRIALQKPHLWVVERHEAPVANRLTSGWNVVAAGQVDDKEESGLVVLERHFEAGTILVDRGEVPRVGPLDLTEHLVGDRISEQVQSPGVGGRTVVAAGPNCCQNSSLTCFMVSMRKPSIWKSLTQVL
jgi:hypothetical protein